MNRPKHNKADNPLLPKDQQLDERHLVDVEDSADISIEDRISMYWMENKGSVVGAILVLLLVIIGINGVRIYADHAQESLKAEFAAADAADTLDAFAKDHSNLEIGGFAALQVADAAYEADEFEKALEYYQVAADALSENILAGRARLGLAFALYNSEQTEAGLAELSAIAKDSSLAESSRAEAAYHLAIEADLNGDTETYEAYLAQINASPMAGPWQQRINMHQTQAR